MSTPLLLQRSRTKGSRLPPGTVCVSRGTKWGNPYRIWYNQATGHYIVTGPDVQVTTRSRYVAHAWAVGQYAAHIDTPGFPTTAEIVTHLRGKALACWCSLALPCHRSVLHAIANKERVEA